MDKISRYAQFVKDILTRHAERWTNDAIEAQLIFDDERHSYQMMLIGWENRWRTYSSITHVRIRNEKCYIEWDGTEEEESMATHLLAAGVPHDDIVLAFYSPTKRKFTEFAAA